MSANRQLMSTLGTNVMRLRVEQELTKTSFALMSNISRPTLNKIENGLCDVRLSYLQRIADALAQDPVYLLLEPRRAERFESARYYFLR